MNFSSKSSDRKLLIYIIGALVVTVVVMLTVAYIFLSNRPPVIFEVITDPDSAKVSMDGEYLGVSPVQVDNPLAGPHIINISKDKYEDYRKEFVVQKNEKIKTVQIILKPLNKGDIDIMSIPLGAEVYINRELKGKTPLFLEGLPAGILKIKLKKEGFDIWQDEIVCRPLETAKLKAELVAIFGELDIESVPTGAAVYIDSREIGICPISKQVEKGNREIEVKKQGFDLWKRSVHVKASEKIKIKAELKSSYGVLNVISVPQGAGVYIDGKKAGNTPLMMAQSKKGNREITIRKRGYDVWKQSVRVIPEKTLNVKAELVAGFGGLEVITHPEDADVSINGKFSGKTPLRLKNIKKGQTRVEVKKACFQTIDKNILIRGDKVAKEKFNLKPLCGSVSVDTFPVESKWYLDGKQKGITPGVMDKIYEGEHTITVEKADYISWSEIIHVKSEKNTPVFVELKSVNWRDPVIGMEFIWVSKGCFEMGCGPWTSECNSDEKPVHEVCLGGFWMGKYEVTFGQWKKMMGEYPFSAIKGDTYPVNEITWNDTKKFISKLNNANQGKYSYRLPTEAEWEYAARSGGKEEIYSGVADIGKCAWYLKNSGGGLHPVGLKEPNGLGVFDMAGNVWEWVEDVYSEVAYVNHNNANPLFDDGARIRVFRGGSFRYDSKWCRSSYRGKFSSDNGDNDLGFRLVRKP